MRSIGKEEAVSPVIGVILMVAITVILAAVIGAFVFGMAGNVQSTKTVAVTTSINSSGGLEITEQGGQDFSSLKNITVKIDGADAGTDETPAIGNVIITTVSLTTAEDHVIVVGNFNDGSSQVLIDKYM
ncbi:MAG: type IV pilin N-terminal domain-containing protein [Methanogenium sp.]|nr:type IV pilin N-terminal domain-containing protein [Methanogenium sp.]